MLSGLTSGAGLVIAGKADVRLRHIEFLRLEPTKALVVMVGEQGLVENRIVDLPPGMSASTLTQASNFLNAHIAGRTLSEARKAIADQMQVGPRRTGRTRAIARRSGSCRLGRRRGGRRAATHRARPRQPVRCRRRRGSAADIDRLRHLFGELESREGTMQLLQLAEEGRG